MTIKIRILFCLGSVFVSQYVFVMVNHHFIGNGLSLICIIYCIHVYTVYIYIFISVSSGLMKSDHLKREL